ncbi:hypothetical protein M514_11315 [Trichuris suis]|uniref:Uncharacterized protein n=1 Tax=Trichuris suis TaxID=68888 RepID=A0A085LS89_9BILA|nr:hypothetical protein M513_11315 [Trichuris suis]KFD62001.1 hypothetical protein M514_11315 [Trichuris suis]
MKEADYFRFGEQFFMQNSGAPMRSSIARSSGSVHGTPGTTRFFTANESIALVLFKRYADDVSAITSFGEDEAFGS